MKHLFLHIARQFPRKDRIELDPAQELRQHIRETLSAEHLTDIIKERLVQKRKRESVREELERLEHELLLLENQRGERVDMLRARLQEAKKNMEKNFTGL